MTAPGAFQDKPRVATQAVLDRLFPEFPILRDSHALSSNDEDGGFYEVSISMNVPGGGRAFHFMIVESNTEFKGILRIGKYKRIFDFADPDSISQISNALRKLTESSWDDQAIYDGYTRMSEFDM